MRKDKVANWGSRALSGGNVFFRLTVQQTFSLLPFFCQQVSLQILSLLIFLLKLKSEGILWWTELRLLLHRCFTFLLPLSLTSKLSSFSHILNLRVIISWTIHLITLPCKTFFVYYCTLFFVAKNGDSQFLISSSSRRRLFVLFLFCVVNLGALLWRWRIQKAVGRKKNPNLSSDEEALVVVIAAV